MKIVIEFLLQSFPQKQIISLIWVNARRFVKEVHFCSLQKNLNMAKIDISKFSEFSSTF